MKIRNFKKHQCVSIFNNQEKVVYDWKIDN